MISVELGSSWSQLALVALSAAAMLLAIIGYVRIVGLRSFSKMSSFDFAVTVAMGSLLAAIALSGSSLAEGVVAVGTLLAVQTALAIGRRKLHLSAVIDNDPLLLMAGPNLLEHNLRRSHVTADDIRAKLRAAGATNYEQVRYVIVESTGDVSVSLDDGALDPDLFSDVRDGARLFG